jgi:hypothetical protein
MQIYTLIAGGNTMSLVNFNIDPLHEFKNELAKIEDQFYLDIATKALSKVPGYFWFVPASASGKYHPKSSLGMGGLVRHVKSVFWISEELLAHPLYAPFTDAEKDEIRVAILLHDACKQGVADDGSHTVAEHPLLVREALNPAHDIIGTFDAWSRICDLIETHMGIWTRDKEGKEILDVPKTKAQLFVHQCDFLASRKFIDVDVTSREAQAGYGSKKEEPTWKSEPATEGQVSYVKKLYIMASEKGLHYPPLTLTDDKGNQILTKGQAGEAITSLKVLLGIS